MIRTCLLTYFLVATFLLACSGAERKVSVSPSKAPKKTAESSEPTTTESEALPSQEKLETVPEETVEEEDEFAEWDAYLKENHYACPGPFETTAKARVFEMGGKRFIHDGYRMAVQNPDKDSSVRIGLIGASKDTAEVTLNNLKATIQWFNKSKVDWIVLNGDIAMDEFDFEDIIDLFLKTNKPLLVVLGNTDSQSTWTRIYKARYKKYPQLIDGSRVRQIVADDVEFWTMSGYHDRAFSKSSGSCVYSGKDVTAAKRALKPDGRFPVVFVSHGPPRGQGKYALDWISDKKNVGDPELSRLIRTKKIRFGLFSHILEAGGFGVDASMKKRVKPGQWSSSLHVNAGTVSGDPWEMNDGRTSYGLAMIVSLDGKRAKYQVKRFASGY